MACAGFSADELVTLELLERHKVYPITNQTAEAAHIAALLLFQTAHPVNYGAHRLEVLLRSFFLNAFSVASAFHMLVDTSTVVAWCLLL
jgi:hypothetical protein